MNDPSIVEQFCAGYLWPDPEWLELDETSFSYWQGRLEQRISVEPYEDVHKWRMDIPLIAEVANPSSAVQVCLTLNRLAAGWSFVVDPDDGSVHALAAMCAPLSFNRFLLRFAEAAKLSAWFCDTVAEPLAAELGGSPIFCHPAAQNELRQVPDALNNYPTAQRERPEWVIDPIRFMFAPVEEVAESFGRRIGEHAGKLEVLGDRLQMTQFDQATGAPSLTLTAGWTEHPLLGMAWCSQAAMHRIPGEALAAGSQFAALMMHRHPTDNLLGSWVDDDGVLTMRQWTTGSELRNYSRVEDWDDGEEVLWSATSTLFDAASWASQMTPEIWSGWDVPIPPAEDADALVSIALSTFSDGTIPEFVPARVGDSQADRSLLWRSRDATLLVSGFFNPAGPTMTTLEICGDPLTGENHLIRFMRHPLSPDYEVIGSIESVEDVHALLPQAMDACFYGSTPNFVDLTLCPENLASAVESALRDRIEAMCSEFGESLPERRSKILKHLGDPWAYAGEAREPGSEREIDPPASADEYEAWLTAATLPENVFTNIIQFGRAWDGSLNYSRSVGALEVGGFDTGPMMLVYSDLGLISSGDDR